MPKMSRLSLILLRQALVFTLSFAIGMGPTWAATNSKITPPQDPSATSNTTTVEERSVTFQNGADEVRIDSQFIVAENPEQQKIAQEWLANQINKTNALGEDFSIITTGEENDPEAQQAFEDLNAKIAPAAKENHVFGGITSKFKNAFNFTVKKIAHFKNFVTQNKRIVFFGVTRGYVNAKVMSMIFSQGFMKDMPIPLGNQLFFPGTQFSVVGDGAAWIAALTACSMSIALQLNGKAFNDWILKPVKFVDDNFNKLADKFLPDMPADKRLAISREISTVGKWTALDIVFFALPVLTLLAYGFPLASGVLLSAAVFAGTVLSGVATQYNTDAAVAKFQLLGLLKNENDEAAKKRVLNISQFLMFGSSVAATILTSMTMGADKLVAYAKVAAMFALGFTLNRYTSKKLQPYLHKKHNSCTDLLKKASGE
jgi:hypothetical protein